MLACLFETAGHVSQNWDRMTIHHSDTRDMLSFSVVCLMILCLVAESILDHMRYGHHSLLSYVLCAVFNRDEDVSV